MDFATVLKGIENTDERLKRFDHDEDIDYYFDQWHTGLKLRTIDDKLYIFIRMDYPKDTTIVFNWPGSEQEYHDMANFLSDAYIKDIIMVLIFMMNFTRGL